MLKFVKYTCCVLLLLMSFSCGDNLLFKSEKKIKQEVQGVWENILLNQMQSREYWALENGNIYLLELNGNKFDTIDAGQYSIDAKLAKAYIDIRDFTSTQALLSDYNSRWSIIELTDDLLYITTRQSGGLLQKEFLRFQ